MENKVLNYLQILFLSIFMVSPNLLSAQITNTEGKLIVNNELTELKFSYAAAQEGYFDNSKEDILVIITDVPLDAKEIEDSFERRLKVSEGTLHGIEVIINSDKEPISTTILHDAFKAPPSGRGYEILENVSLKDEEISGKIFTSKPNEFFGTTYEYSAIFHAAVIREIPPTEAEKLEAAKSTDEALQFFNELKELHTRRWNKKGLSGSFGNPLWEQFHRSQIAQRFPEGEIQILRISNNSGSLGYLYNYIWRKRVYVVQSGFDIPKDNRLIPGYVTHSLAIVYNKKKGMHTYDFMYGSSLESSL